MKAFGFFCRIFHHIHGIKESVGLHAGDRAIVHCVEHDAYAWYSSYGGYDGVVEHYDVITDLPTIDRARASIKKFEAEPEEWKEQMLRGANE